VSDDWPDLPPAWRPDPKLIAERRRLILGAEIDLAKAQKATVSGEPASSGVDESETKLHDTLATLSAGSIDRAREGARFIETAAAALGTIYTGILGFVFVASEKPLPGRGLYAAIFLGIAIVGAAYYLAFVQRIKSIGRVHYSRSRSDLENVWRRTEWLGDWTSNVVRARSWALRGAVFALAFGVAFMPAAFLPEKLPSNPFAASEPSPSPDTSVVWPSPPTDIADPALAAVLYQAQVDEFVKALHEPAAAEQVGGTDTSTLLFVLFLISLGVTALGAAWNALWGLPKRLSSSAAERIPLFGATNKANPPAPVKPDEEASPKS
jgi:hypothetical protein